MAIYSIVKVELIKLFHKKTTLLLLLLMFPVLLFGIGMSFGMSFFVSDGGDGGVNAVGLGLSGLGFTANMMGQNIFILFLVMMIISSISFAQELESGQMKSEIIRICGRGKILLAKYISILILTFITLFLFTLWSLLIYMLLVKNSNFANGMIFDALYIDHLKYILFIFIGVSVATSFSFLIGIKLKTFPCFALAYITWFISLYTDFMGDIKLFIPYNMPNHILDNLGTVNTIPYACLYIGYCIFFLSLATLIFKRIDIKH